MVSHACNPSTSGSQGRWITWDQEFKTTLATWWNPISTKNTKISWMWWWAPMSPATQEAEGHESLELERWRLQWAEIGPLNSSLNDKNKTTVSKRKKKREIKRERKKENHLSFIVKERKELDGNTIKYICNGEEIVTGKERNKRYYRNWKK